MQSLWKPSAPPPLSIFLACTLLFHVMTFERVNASPTKADDCVSQCMNTNDKYCCNSGVKKVVKRSEEPHKSCSYWHPDGLGSRKVSKESEATQMGEFPWQVAFLKSANSNLSIECGASLIHPEVLLTSVHCVKKWKTLDELVIRLGEWDAQNDDEQFAHQDRKVSKILTHEEFYNQENDHHNDIALVIVDRPFELGPNVGTICLPSQDFKFEKNKCYVAGWEKNAFDKFKFVEEKDGFMKKQEMTLMPRNPCLSLLKRTQLGQNFKLHDSFICARGEYNKQMSFRGHNGCPLMCPIKENSKQLFQAGIIMASPKGYEDDTPIMYVNVARFRDWIDKQMAIHNFDTSYYTPQSKSNKITFIS